MDIKSMKIMDKLSKYFPELASRILQIRKNTTALRSVADKFLPYRDEFLSKHNDSNFRKAVIDIENKLFKASKDAPVLNPNAIKQ